MYRSQLAHYSRVENLLNMLVNKDSDPSTVSFQYTQQVRQALSNEQQPPPMPAHTQSNSQPPPNSAVGGSSTLFRNSFMPDGTWDSLFSNSAGST